MTEQLKNLQISDTVITSLPAATSAEIGCVKIQSGSGLSVDTNGSLVVTATGGSSYHAGEGISIDTAKTPNEISITKAASSKLGGVKVNGNGLSVDTTGQISMTPATLSAIGGVKPNWMLSYAADGTLCANVHFYTESEWTPEIQEAAQYGHLYFVTENVPLIN